MSSYTVRTLASTDFAALETVVIAKLCGVAVDARRSTLTRDPARLARATRWIAGNYLAVRRGRPVELVRVESFEDLVSAIAVAPVLVDRATLPARWALALRLLGLPLLERPRGARVLSLAPISGGGYRVRVTATTPLLAA